MAQKQPYIGIELCEVGCGNKANYRFWNGKLCCSRSSISCSAHPPWKYGGHRPPLPYEGNEFCNWGCGNVAKFIQHNGIHLCESHHRKCKAYSEKRKEHFLKTTGFESPMHNPAFQKQIQESNLKNRGYRTPFESKEILDKAAKRVTELYGVDNVFKLKEIQEEIKRNNLEEFGCENISGAPGISDKKRSTWTKNYGVDHPLKCKEILDKVQKTNEKLYGVKSPMSNPVIARKSFLNGIKTKRFKLPSGNIISLAGYESDVLDEFLLQGFKEEDFDFSLTPFPTRYINAKGRKCIYTPDFFLPKLNLIIEVKSTYTMFLELELNMRKFWACKNLGYNFTFIVNRAHRKLQLLEELHSHSESF